MDKKNIYFKNNRLIVTVFTEDAKVWKYIDKNNLDYEKDKKVLNKLGYTTAMYMDYFLSDIISVDIAGGKLCLDTYGNIIYAEGKYQKYNEDYNFSKELFSDKRDIYSGKYDVVYTLEELSSYSVDSLYGNEGEYLWKHMNYVMEDLKQLFGDEISNTELDEMLVNVNRKKEKMLKQTILLANDENNVELQHKYLNSFSDFFTDVKMLLPPFLED